MRILFREPISVLICGYVMALCWQSCTFSRYWLNKFRLTEHDLAHIFCLLQSGAVMHKLQQIQDMSLFPDHASTREACVQRTVPRAAWDSSLLMLCSVNQVSWAVTTTCASEQRALSHSLPTVFCNLITQMKQAQTISSYKIRNCIWQFLNKCIQVQLKAFQFCQVLVE